MITVVETSSVGGTVSAAGFPLNYPSPAAPGDLLVICACSDATVLPPAGFILSPGAGDVGNSGYYVFWGQAAGGETGALVKTAIGGGPFPTAYCYLRASGALPVTPFDTAALAAAQTPGVTFPAAPVTLTGAGRLTVAFAAASGLGGVAQAPISWGTGYVARQFAATGTGASDQAGWLATKVGAGPGVESPLPSALASPTSNRYLITVAFAPGAGPVVQPEKAAPFLTFLP